MFPQHLPDYIKTEIGIEAQTISGDDTVDVEDIDRQDLYSGVLALVTSTTLDAGEGDEDLEVTIEHSSEEGTGYEEYTSETITVNHGADEINEIDLDLKAAKRYLKVQVVGQGAADDSIDIAATLTLGGAVDKPVD